MADLAEEGRGELGRGEVYRKDLQAKEGRRRSLALCGRRLAKIRIEYPLLVSLHACSLLVCQRRGERRAAGEVGIHSRLGRGTLARL